MSDEAAFLRALEAAPADDLARLAYADWLDERGAAARAEYLRLEADRHRLTARDPRRAALFARMVRLRPAAGPDWLARGDRSTRYSFFWTQYQCAVRGGRSDAPLDHVRYAGNARTLFPKGVAVGDYVYVLAYRARTVFLVGRMLIADLRVSRYGPYVEAAVGAEGTPIRLDLPVTGPALERMSWFSGKVERTGARAADGSLASFESVARVLRLTPRTAADFDALLRGDAPPPSPARPG